MRMDPYEKQLRARWKRSGVEGLPAPWRRVLGPAVGGILAVGLDPTGRYLLTISNEGRGLLDCRRGERVARDRNEDWDSWMDDARLTVLGIGPLEGQTVRVAGAFLGGGLPALTSDGWYVQQAPMSWSSACAWAEAPGRNPGFYSDGTFYKLWDCDRPFACGFSESGTTLVIACSHTIDIWVRDHVA